MLTYVHGIPRFLRDLAVLESNFERWKFQLNCCSTTVKKEMSGSQISSQQRRMGSQRQSFSTAVALKVAVLTCIAFVLGRYTQEGRGVVKEQKLWSAPRPASNEEEALPVSLLDLPSSTKEIVINVGSNLDPIMPAYTMGPCAHSIAVEPIVGCQIMEHRQLSVIHAAVSGRPGVAYMTKNNFDGQSSSLAKVAREDFWNTDKERGDGVNV